MKQDGSLRSIWQAGQEDYKPSNSWDKDTVYDVVIVGGGITGLTTALLLQQQGKKCIIAEAHTIGYGTSLGTSAHLNTVLDTPYQVIEKNFGEDAARQMAVASGGAIDLIESIVTDNEIDCRFHYLTGYLFSQNEQQDITLGEIKDAAEKAGVVVDWSPQIPLPFSFTRACRIGFQAQLHIGRYLTGLAGSFEAAGGVILQHCVVSGVKEEEEVTAITSLGEIRSRHLVYATHIPPDNDIIQASCTAHSSYVIACCLNSGSYPEGLVYDMKDPYNYFRTEEIDGIKYLIAGGFDHKTDQEKDTEKVFGELEAFLRQHFDIANIEYKWTAQYYESVDGLPYIGRIPGHKHIYIGTGYSGNGIVLGTVAAQMIRDAISGIENPFAALLSPARIKPL